MRLSHEYWLRAGQLYHRFLALAKHIRLPIGDWRLPVGLEPSSNRKSEIRNRHARVWGPDGVIVFLSRVNEPGVAVWLVSLRVLFVKRFSQLSEVRIETYEATSLEERFAARVVR